MDTPMAYSGTTTAIDAAGRGIRWMRWLVLMNLVLVALQPVSAGFLLSGYERAVALHAAGALGLQLGALVQVITALVLWQRRRVPGWVAGFSMFLVVLVFLEVGLGYSKRFWLHVPIAVGMFGGLIKQSSRLDALWRTTQRRP